MYYKEAIRQALQKTLYCASLNALISSLLIRTYETTKFHSSFIIKLTTTDCKISTPIRLTSPSRQCMKSLQSTHENRIKCRDLSNSAKLSQL
jgi:hypothetical protein